MNWPILKLLLRDWPPLFSRDIAGTAAGLILAGIAVWRDGLRHRRTETLTIGEGAVVVYTMPIWATLFAWPIPGIRPTLRDAAALLLGLAGLVVLLGQYGFALSPDKITGILLALGSATLFALGGVLSRTPLPMPPMSLVAWQVGLGCFPMIILGLMCERPDIGALTTVGWCSLIYMTLGPMGICYLTWFATLRRLPPATAAMGTLVVPVMGVIGAAALLGEPLGLRELIAMTLTLGGVTLALRRPAVAA